ncbi:MAG: hypothetical protein HZB43_13105 [candidate division Zixibacteria bacterium]|nr:hypothetical protein [candidate division Zixibacteria bacterium]
MNTRGSDSAAPKVAKKAVEQKAGKSAIVTNSTKPQDHPGQSPKPLISKDLKAAKGPQKKAPKLEPVVIKHTGSSPDEPPRRSIFKSTFNTHDIMHAPVEKTIQMLDKILAGERLFTM